VIQQRGFFFIRIRFYCTLQWLFPAERKLQNDKISAEFDHQQ